MSAKVGSKGGKTSELRKKSKEILLKLKKGQEALRNPSYFAWATEAADGSPIPIAPTVSETRDCFPVHDLASIQPVTIVKMENGKSPIPLLPEFVASAWAPESRTYGKEEAAEESKGEAAGRPSLQGIKPPSFFAWENIESAAPKPLDADVARPPATKKADNPNGVFEDAMNAGDWKSEYDSHFVPVTGEQDAAPAQSAQKAGDSIGMHIFEGSAEAGEWKSEYDSAFIPAAEDEAAQSSEAPVAGKCASTAKLHPAFYAWSREDGAGEPHASRKSEYLERFEAHPTEAAQPSRSKATVVCSLPGVFEYDGVTQVKASEYGDKFAIHAIKTDAASSATNAVAEHAVEEAPKDDARTDDDHLFADSRSNAATAIDGVTSTETTDGAGEEPTFSAATEQATVDTESPVLPDAAAEPGAADRDSEAMSIASSSASVSAASSSKSFVEVHIARDVPKVAPTEVQRSTPEVPPAGINVRYRSEYNSNFVWPKVGAPAREAPRDKDIVAGTMQTIPQVEEQVQAAKKALAGGNADKFTTETRSKYSWPENPLRIARERLSRGARPPLWVFGEGNQKGPVDAPAVVPLQPSESAPTPEPSKIPVPASAWVSTTSAAYGATRAPEASSQLLDALAKDFSPSPGPTTLRTDPTACVPAAGAILPKSASTITPVVVSPSKPLPGQIVGLREAPLPPRPRPRSAPIRKQKPVDGMAKILCSKPDDAFANPLLMNRRYPSLSEKQSGRWTTESRASFGGAWRAFETK